MNFNWIRKNKKSRNSPVALWFNGDEARNILAPEGYTPLSKNETINRCIHKIADLVSNMTIMLMENGINGDVRIKNELSKKIDIYPNNSMNRKNFIYKIVKDMCISGNCVVLPVIKDGFIDSLKFLNNNNITYEETEDDYIVKYKASKIFNSDEVLHFVCIPDDDYPYKGQGYAPMIIEAVQNLLQANATKNGFLKTKWKPSLIISIQSDIEELQDAKKRNKILDSYAKTTDIGEPWLIPAGELDVKEIRPLTLNDLAIQDSITLDMKTIAGAIGVPAFMLGIGTFNKDEYNNFISTTIMSIAINIQQELTKKLLYAPDKYFKFNPKTLMQYNLSEQISFVKELVGGGMLSRNEGRAEFDYAPVDAEGMNDYAVLENYIPVDKIGEQSKLNQEGGGEK